MIDNPLVKAEIASIQGKKENATSWDVQATLIFDSVDQLKFRNVVSENVTGDYVSGLGDNRFITVQVSPLTYRDIIVPNKDKLFIRVEKTLKSGTKQIADRGDLKYKNYMAFLVNPIDMSMVSPIRNPDDPNLIDVQNLATIVFQLVEIDLYFQMNKETSGVYPDCTVTDVIFTQLLTELRDNASTDALVNRNYEGLRGLKSEAFDNKRKYDNIVVKTGVRLGKLTRYIQQNYGISPYGVNTYYRNGLWYMYPLYKNVERFNKEKRTMVIFNIPKQELPSVNRTFTIRGKNIIVLATGEVKAKDNALADEANLGNAVSFTSAGHLEGSLFLAQGNKAKFATSKTNTIIGIKDSAKGTNNVRRTKNPYTVNPYPEIAEMHRTRGSVVSIDWTNSDDDLVVPGMPCRVYYEEGEELLYREGTIIGMRSNTAPSSGDFADDDYRTVTRLMIHMEFKK